MAKNPFKDSTKKTRRASDQSFLELGVVKQVDADSSHTVLVEILSSGTESGPVVAADMVPREGDINVPEVGSLVVIGRVKGRRPVVLGALYSTDSDVPTYNPGDRRIGHDSTQAQFLIEEDGTVKIDSESGQPVLINGAEPNTSIDRTDVSDSGVLVVEDVSDINFGSDLPVTDDGDGTVTVDVNRYTDAEAVSAVESVNPLSLSGNLQIPEGSSIEDGGGIDRIDIGSSITRVWDEASGTSLILQSANNRHRVHLPAGFTWDISDAEGGFQAVRYSTSPSSPGTLELTNAVIDDRNGNRMLDSVVATGQVTLSSGSAVVNTGISATDATFMLAVGVDDPNADTKIAGRLFWDDSAGTYKIEIVEQETAVGNPTVNYDVVRVR